MGDWTNGWLLKLLSAKAYPEGGKKEGAEGAALSNSFYFCLKYIN